MSQETARRYKFLYRLADFYVDLGDQCQGIAADNRNFRFRAKASLKQNKGPPWLPTTALYTTGRILHFHRCFYIVTL